MGQYFFKIDDKFLPLTGGTVSGNTYIDGNLSANTISLSSTTNNNSLTQILGINSSSGELEYRNVDSIIGGNQFGNVYFVSPEGNDSSGEYGKLLRPFKTISGARNQLLNDTLTGQTLIYVYPGTYDEAELQYPNGKMYLSPGSLIRPSAKINGAGAAMTAVNQGTKTFTFNGNWADHLVVGNRFLVIGGANAGTYTISLATNVVGTDRGCSFRSYTLIFCWRHTEN